jgi:hypothetical protein
VTQAICVDPQLSGEAANNLAGSVVSIKVSAIKPE